jgi:hypothetical protein
MAFRSQRPLPNRPVPLKITYDRSLGRRGRLIVITGLLLLASLFALGFFHQKDIRDDGNKVGDMAYIITALNSYYDDSSEFIESRKYPISRCSSNLNSFDFEYTLRKALTGKNIGDTTQNYIDDQNYPYDKLGKYVSKFSEYDGMKTELIGAHIPIQNCRDALPHTESGAEKNSYFDNHAICTFDNRFDMLKFDFFTNRNCYLYTSTSNGDSYKLAYYSSARNAYVVYSQYRNDPIKAPRISQP